MRHEARRIIDAARERGIVLRLFGGLAVREHCTAADFCERDHADLDLVGLSAQVKQLAPLMADLGYHEDAQVRLSTAAGQRQFLRPCRHTAADGAQAHDADRVDVFLDTFHMDHEIGLKDRLAQGEYTIPVTDVLLTKLQVVRHNDKDVRDIITLLKDVPMAGDEERDPAPRDQAARADESEAPAGERPAAPDTGIVQPDPRVVQAAPIAAACAEDWGLHHDVLASLELVERLLPRYGLDAAAAARVRERIGRLRDALEAAPKSFAWRLRAKVGTRLPWYDEVEEQEG
ncbi:MAG TPA: hypothetical protein VK576_02140 [Thermoleophilia bacterium]|nr:hypothetical protein [Thermoleophilia bacterium]